MLLRALVVAAASTCALAAILLSAPEVAPTGKTAAASRSGRDAARRSASSTPVNIVKDDTPLDADFSASDAVRAWSSTHRAENSGVLQFGPVRVARAIVEHVVDAAKSTGSDPALLMAIADKESSFSPKAKASTSSASGLFQFIDSTWLKAVRMFGWRHGQQEAAEAIEVKGGDLRVAPQRRAAILAMRNDPYLSAALAAEMLKYDGDKIAERIGRPLTAGETYLIHFLGPDDAARFMQKVEEAPHTPAAALLPKPARANKPIFYARKGKKMQPKSVGEVHEAFEAMMGQRASRYKGVDQDLPDGALAFTQ
ncbi:MULTISPECIES: transglycosylase SLT domain-containing protein [Methylosinus]|nr:MULTISPECIES: transglycosylase SLT domain-containing protein [Methylosinus]